MAETLAIIAGWGRFPFHVAESARRQGYRVVALALNGETDPTLEAHVEKLHWTPVAALGRMIRLLHREGATKAIMAGGVRKTGMYSRLRIFKYRPDWTALKLWYRVLTDKKDATLLGTFARLLETQGVEMLACSKLCPELLGPAGTLAGRAPTVDEERDLAFGWGVARELARLDIGQSVLVKERAVIAVEAIEGTDAAIRRSGELCRRGGFSLVKVARPAQDMRFDVPTIGPVTIDSLAQAGGRAIGYEAGRTLVLEIETTLARANERGIVIVGLTDEQVNAIEAGHKTEIERERQKLGTAGAAALDDKVSAPSPGATA